MDLAMLKKQRQMMKAKLTRFNNYLNTIDDTHLHLEQLTRRRDDILPVLNEFTNIYTQIQLIEESDDNTALEEFETTYYSVLTTADRLLSSNSGVRNANTNVADVDGELPKLILPKFSGDCNEWLPFYNSFKSLIHERNSLSNIKKYHYLVSCLKGDAADLLAATEICSESYEASWQLVVDTFNNKRKLTHSHLLEIVNISRIENESVENLQKLSLIVRKNVQALKMLGFTVDELTSVIFIFLLSQKLDPITAREWERSLSKDEFPPLDNFLKFIQDKIDSIQNYPQSFKKPVMNTEFNREISCAHCKGNHVLSKCFAFKKMSIAERFQRVKSLNICINCLKKANHPIQRCNASGCSVCQKNHHVLLHRYQGRFNNDANPGPSDSAVALSVPNSANVLLSTAVVRVRTRQGEYVKARALLDSGAQTNFVTAEFANKIGAHLVETNYKFTGINGSNSVADTVTTLSFKSNHSNFSATINCFVTQNITVNLPQTSFQRNLINMPKGIKLADPTFNITGPIDILIGGQLFLSLLCAGRIQSEAQSLCLQKTKLGWIIGGEILNNNQSPVIGMNGLSVINFNLEKFWALEDPLGHHVFVSPCDIHFKETHSRNDQGRFIVRLPLKGAIDTLQNSRIRADKRFKNLESRFRKDGIFAENYKLFMSEYISLGHMKLVSAPCDDIAHYYIPHHAIFKADSLTTKFRVVFDASAKTINGPSLNDLLQKGPVLQQDLFNILLRFRFSKVVLSADIVKMYRQILIHPSDRPFHRILWRENSREEIKTYELQTITYGTVPASYLATRCLQQLAEEASDELREAAEVIRRDFYVDDLLTGFDDVDTAIRVRNQLISILDAGGFKLNKFNSNNDGLLSDIIDTQDSIIVIDKDNYNKTLGLQWHSNTDHLSYKVIAITTAKISKRAILGSMASIFDPLGLINPIIVVAKIIIQKLWQLNLGWDDVVPQYIREDWEGFSRNLSYLESINIPRSVVMEGEIQLIGFCDASERAYGACVYVRSQDSLGVCQTQLLCAKSRVSPLKTQTMPRLELCGALLLAELINKIKDALRRPITAINYFTDSTIVLAWIRSPPEEWKQFVSNRIMRISELSPPESWGYVPSIENPADIISRGMSAKKLINSNLWWHGPSWLNSNKQFQKYETPAITLTEIPDRRVALIHVSATIKSEFNLFEKFSSVRKLFRVVAYMHRFSHNSRNRIPKLSGFLTAHELQVANIALIKLVQASEFGLELNNLICNKDIGRKSRLRMLNPILDENGIIRVGGRLANAKIKFEIKYPILLPAKHTFTKLIYEQAHLQTLHAGPQATLAYVRQKYWPLCAAQNIKKIIRSCVVCARNKPTAIHQLMGNLPADRVNVSRPFLNSGVDYCGPFLIKGGPRSRSSHKAYAAVFICFATRAIHVEIVSDLTSAAFIAALRRFISRRGLVKNIYSDNGTNFVGANKEIQNVHKYFSTGHCKESMADTFSNEGISWHFSPPYSPHMGGIWEAAVKSLKHHLKRVAGEMKFTFEELSTYFAQIEAILNSRPLTPLSDDPNDLSCLTPGHFLIGAPLTALPSEDYTGTKQNRLSRWQHIQRMSQHFWKRWSIEYLNQLQGRAKWYSTNTNIRVGQLVVLREDNLPPTKWKTGRITALHPGADKIVRVVSVRTGNGVTKRSVQRLCLLPISDT